MRTVGVIDYGAGNFTSVWNALTRIDAKLVRVDTPRELDDVSHVILPGVGPFAGAMRKLESRGLVDAIRHQLTVIGKPFLGICVGMQLLGTIGHEFEDCRGLDCIPGVVDKIPVDDAEYRLPHMGWNELSLRGAPLIFKGMSRAPIFYFVHSYQLRPADPSAIAATCEYGSELVAAVQSENIYGVQFHPEKSQQDGLQLLRNFISL